jgi:hypothetical protein
MAVALVPMPELVGICDLREEGAWVFGQRVEEDLVDNEAGGLFVVGRSALHISQIRTWFDLRR